MTKQRMTNDIAGIADIFSVITTYGITGTKKFTFDIDKEEFLPFSIPAGTFPKIKSVL